MTFRFAIFRFAISFRFDIFESLIFGLSDILESLNNLMGGGRVPLATGAFIGYKIFGIFRMQWALMSWSLNRMRELCVVQRAEIAEQKYSL